MKNLTNLIMINLAILVWAPPTILCSETDTPNQSVEFEENNEKTTIDISIDHLASNMSILDNSMEYDVSTIAKMSSDHSYRDLMTRSEEAIEMLDKMENKILSDKSDDAIEIAKTIIALCPDIDRAMEMTLLYLVIAHFLNGSHLQAINSAEQLLDKYPNNPYVQYANYIKAVSSFHLRISDRTYFSELEALKAKAEFDLVINDNNNSTYKDLALSYSAIITNSMASRLFDNACFYFYEKEYIAALTQLNEYFKFAKSANTNQKTTEAKILLMMLLNKLVIAKDIYTVSYNKLELIEQKSRPEFYRDYLANSKDPSDFHESAKQSKQKTSDHEEINDIESFIQSEEQTIDKSDHEEMIPEPDHEEIISMLQQDAENSEINAEVQDDISASDVPDTLQQIETRPTNESNSESQIEEIQITNIEPAIDVYQASTTNHNDSKPIQSQTAQAQTAIEKTAQPTRKRVRRSLRKSRTARSKKATSTPVTNV